MRSGREELRAAFSLQARGRLEVLERGLRGREDAATMRREAHTLRGSASVLELEAVAELAAQLENALDEPPDLERAGALVARLRGHVETLPRGLRPEGGIEPAAGHGLVLYVEDDPPNALLVERMLRERPTLRLLEARTGSEGLRLARERRPVLVLLDLRLPDMDGLDVARRLRSDPETADLPIAVVTGGVGDDVIQALHALGVEEILAKPFATTRLLAVVDRARRP